MKIVLDTNILISGFLTTTGPSQYILDLAIKKHTVILSGYILREFKEKLLYKLEIPAGLTDEAIAFLRKRTVIPEKVKTHPKTRFSDTKDRPILALIEEVKPHYFITGDKKLLTIKKLGSTLFLTAREAMEVL